MLSLICHYADRERLGQNLLASLEGQVDWQRQQSPVGTPPREGEPQLLLLSGVESLAQAYAAAERNALYDLCVFVHEDVKLPAPWLLRFTEAVKDVEKRDPNWAVIGVFGTYAEHGRQQYVGNVRDAFAYRAHQLDACPRRVESVDGMLVAKRRSVFAWDTEVPGFHGYAEDLCCAARAAGAGVWVVNVFTEHACKHTDLETDQGYQAAKAYVSEKWKAQRPIYTSCGVWT